MYQVPTVSSRERTPRATPEGLRNEASIVLFGDTVALSSPNGDAVGPGAFTETFEGTLSQAGVWTVCAYVDDSTFDVPTAADTDQFQVAPPPAL